MFFLGLLGFPSLFKLGLEFGYSIFEFIDVITGRQVHRMQRVLNFYYVLIPALYYLAFFAKRGIGFLFKRRQRLFAAGKPRAGNESLRRAPGPARRART